MKQIFIILILYTSNCLAQNELFTKDTSYTIFSTFNKLKKEFPYIQSIKPILPDRVNALRDICYSKIGSRELNLDIFYEESEATRKNGVILIHGGGWRTGDKSLTFPFALQLAKRGYVSVSVEYRLSPEAIFPAAIIDIKNSIKWFKKNALNYFVDTNNIAVLGYSAGGQIASLAGFSLNGKEFEDFSTYPGYSSKVNAIINIDGVLDFLSNGSEEFDEIPDKENPRAAHKWLGVSHIENPEIWAKASPINYIDRNSIPTLFINSSRNRFSAGKDEAILKFKEYDIYYEVHTFENTTHGFWLFHPWFNQTVDFTISFLDKVIKTSTLQ